MVVDNRIILEIKATEVLPAFAKRQLINYLAVTSFPLGLILHFGPEPRFHRFVDSQKIRFRRHFGGELAPDHCGPTICPIPASLVESQSLAATRTKGTASRVP